MARLVDVLPRTAAKNQADQRCVDIETLADFPPASPGRSQLANDWNVSFSQFGVAVTRSQRSFFWMGVHPVPLAPRSGLRIQIGSVSMAGSRPALRNHVGAVLGIRSEE